MPRSILAIQTPFRESLLIQLQSAKMLVQSNPSERHVWVANVGLRGFSGAHIVDLILTNEKKMKYVAGMANCFDGQWIVLREIRNVRTAGIDGRCRCAIQLDAIRYSFEDHPELFMEEWVGATHMLKEQKRGRRTSTMQPCGMRTKY